MLFNEKKYEFEIEGQKCSFSTGKLARKSQVAVRAQMGGTIVLATVNLAPAKEDAAWFPLRVEYMEKMYAAGEISGSRFVKRERFPNDDAIARGRVIDRSVRPRFPEDYRGEVLVIIKVLSYDENADPMLLSINATSVALMLSKSPFIGPVAGIAVAVNDDKLIPKYNYNKVGVDSDDGKMNLVLAGDGKKVNNIDADMKEIPEDKVYEAIEYGLTLMNPWLAAQNEFIKIVSDGGEIEKDKYRSFAAPADLVREIEHNNTEEIKGNLNAGTKFKDSAVAEELFEEYEGEHSKMVIEEAYEKAAKHILKKTVLEDRTRVDGREFDEIREVDTEVSVLSGGIHGSGLFTRGMTQVMTIATLDTNRNRKLVNDMTGDKERAYMHYYSDSPFTFGEVGRVSYVASRREVGHGALAEKALRPVIPSQKEFPYVIVLMSEVLSERGSSSMASVCGSTLALMDAGVPIKKPVAGIAIGLVANTNEGAINLESYELVTDMIAEEDFYGLMDFKVTGTKDGVTAIQMDTKSLGLPMEVVQKAIKRAKIARMSILENMMNTIATPREQLAATAPHVESVTISQDKIGDLIGPGGKNIKNIKEMTDAEINVEDDGSVFIYGSSTSVKKAVKMVEDSTFEPQIGDKFTGKVTRVEDYGAFVEFKGGLTGLVHISKLADGFVKDVHTLVSVGDSMDVEILGFDRGKIKLGKVQK